jgi:hypothetical protein
VRRKADEAARLADEKQKADEAARQAEKRRKADEAVRLAEEQRKQEETNRLAAEKRKTQAAVTRREAETKQAWERWRVTWPTLYLGATILAVMTGSFYFNLGKRSPGLYAQWNLTAFSELNDSSAFGSQSGDPGSDIPIDFNNQVKGLCLATDVLKGRRLQWSDLKTCH